MSQELVPIAHLGAPCDPPIVNDIHFAEKEDGIFVGMATSEQAEHLLRVPAFKPFGGSLTFFEPNPPAPAEDEGSLDAEIAADQAAVDADAQAVAAAEAAQDAAAEEAAKAKLAEDQAKLDQAKGRKK